MAWVIISPFCEKNCMSEEDFQKYDSAMYKVLNIHASYAEQFLEVERRLREDAYPEEIINYLQQSDADVLAFGHGWKDLITANNCLVWLDTSLLDSLASIVINRAFVFVSCLTGLVLGQELIRKGARAFFGFADNAISPADKKAGYCRYFYAPFIGIIEAAIAIQNGASVEEAARRALQRWDEEIAYWQNSYKNEKIVFEDGSEREVTASEAQLLISCLEWNKEVFVAYPVGLELEKNRKGGMLALLGSGAVLATAFFAGRHERR